MFCDRRVLRFAHFVHHFGVPLVGTCSKYIYITLSQKKTNNTRLQLLDNRSQSVMHYCERSTFTTVQKLYHENSTVRYWEILIIFSVCFFLIFPFVFVYVYIDLCGLMQIIETSWQNVRPTAYITITVNTITDWQQTDRPITSINITVDDYNKYFIYILDPKPIIFGRLQRTWCFVSVRRAFQVLSAAVTRDFCRRRGAAPVWS